PIAPRRFEPHHYWVDVSRVDIPTAALPARRLATAAAEAVFETDVSLDAFPWLTDHRVFDEWVVPGSFHVAAALAALDRLGLARSMLREIVFVAPLVLEGTG